MATTTTRRVPGEHFRAEGFEYEGQRQRNAKLIACQICDEPVIAHVSELDHFAVCGYCNENAGPRYNNATWQGVTTVTEKGSDMSNPKIDASWTRTGAGSNVEERGSTATWQHQSRKDQGRAAERHYVEFVEEQKERARNAARLFALEWWEASGDTVEIDVDAAVECVDNFTWVQAWILVPVWVPPEPVEPWGAKPDDEPEVWGQVPF